MAETPIPGSRVRATTKHGTLTVDEIAAMQPGMARLMDEVSRRYWVLYYAAKARNWELARYMLKESEKVLTTASHFPTAAAGTTGQTNVLRVTQAANKTSRTVMKHTRGGSRRSSRTYPPSAEIAAIRDTGRSLIIENAIACGKNESTQR